MNFKGTIYQHDCSSQSKPFQKSSYRKAEKNSPAYSANHYSSDIEIKITEQIC